LREASPLFNSLLIPTMLKERGEEILERGFAPLLPTHPPSLNKGRGQGDRLLNDLNI